MAKRQVFHSVKRKGVWTVTRSNKAVSTHPTQVESESEAKRLARAAYAGGGLGQAVMHRADGEIRTEHTYGRDPERFPG